MGRWGLEHLRNGVQEDNHGLTPCGAACCQPMAFESIDATKQSNLKSDHNITVHGYDSPMIRRRTIDVDVYQQTLTRSCSQLVSRLSVPLDGVQKEAKRSPTMIAQSVRR